MHKGKIKLVAIDLDGTLLTSRKTISARTHRALRGCMELGVRVVLATARPPRGVRDYYKALKLATPQINYNGALIWDEGGRRVVEHLPLHMDRAWEVIRFARRIYPEILVTVEILDKMYTDHFTDDPAYMTETDKFFAPDYIGPLEAFLTVPATKVMLLGKPEWIAELERRIPAKFSKKVGHTRSDAWLLQILNPQVSKGGALRSVAEKLHIEAAEVLAIGDAPNDMDMIVYAGVGVVVENGWEGVKALADHVVPSNDADGVAVALERWVLGG